MIENVAPKVDVSYEGTNQSREGGTGAFRNVVVEIAFEPGTAVKGALSQLDWGHPDLMAGLRLMFHAKEDEVIGSIEVHEGEGIKAYFVKPRDQGGLPDPVKPHP